MLHASCLELLFIVYFHFRQDRVSLSVAILLVLYLPMYALQLFTWIIFAVIASIMCYRSRHTNDQLQNAPNSELKKNLGILVLLFTFLGLPWLFVVTVLVFGIGVFIYVAFIIDALQGPALFVIRVVRLREVRQFWKRLLCCNQIRNSSVIISMHDLTQNNTYRVQ